MCLFFQPIAFLVLFCGDQSNFKTKVPFYFCFHFVEDYFWAKVNRDIVTSSLRTSVVLKKALLNWSILQLAEFTNEPSKSIESCKQMLKIFYLSFIPDFILHLRRHIFQFYITAELAFVFRLRNLIEKFFFDCVHQNNIISSKISLI